MKTDDKYILKLEKESAKLLQKIIKIIFKAKINAVDLRGSLKIEIPDKDNQELIKKRCCYLLYVMPRLLALSLGIANHTLPKSMVSGIKKDLIKTIKNY